VIIDPGHGGSETGASGPHGLLEKTVNFDISVRTVNWLQERGVSALMTRTADYRVPIRTRGEFTRLLQPKVFISIHHNGGPANPIDEPGTEIFHQWQNDDSKRLGGLLFDEIFTALDAVPGDHDFEGTNAHHTQWRLNSDGDADLYGVLRRSAEANVVGVLTEATFMNTAGEEAFLARAEVRQLEAEAIGRAIVRYLDGEQPANGSFDDGIIFQGTLADSGRVDGCEDPEMRFR